MAFNLLSVLSLLLLVATCVLWVRNHWKRDTIVFQLRGTRWEAASGQGRLSLTNRPQRLWDASQAEKTFEDAVNTAADEYNRAMRNHFMRRAKAIEPAAPEDFPSGTPEWVRKKAMVVDEDRRKLMRKKKEWIKRRDEAQAILDKSIASLPPRVDKSMSLTWPAVASAIAPSLWIASFVRRGERRRKAGCCPRCGYDLRATPERCLECGHSVNEKVA